MQKSEGKEVTVATGTMPAPECVVRLYERTAALQATGLSYEVAFGRAQIEERIAEWPAEWEKNLHVLIYGDFEAPNHDFTYSSLGITIQAGNLQGDLNRAAIKTALCVVRAIVTVQEKSWSGVSNAIERLNTFLGIWTIIDWGNRAIGWDCYLISPIFSGAGGPFEKEGIETAFRSIECKPLKVKCKVKAALNWIREPKQMMLEGYRSDSLRVYSGYWNAFECLVDAVCLIVPQSKLNKHEKQAGIERFLNDRGGKLDVKSLRECYQQFVDPGFVAKASHALRVCASERSDGYIKECFRAKPKEEQLYAVRNAINHGEIDINSLQEVFRVEEKLNRLQMIVFRMLRNFILFPCPRDSDHG
ncbi:MAG: hypothetical protein WAN46_08140 [Gammaproteobacteria bacterium]